MAKLTRAVQKVFGASAQVNEIEQIGSLRNGAQNFTTDPETLQSLNQYLQGLKAIVSATTLIPELSDLNALYFLITRQLAYIFQEGINEWEAGTTYYLNSLVKKTGTNTLYCSLANDNIGNALTDAAKWAVFNSDANIAGALVQRDVSGNFSAGTITASLSGNASGTAYNITQWLINQHLGVRSAPSFAGLFLTTFDGSIFDYQALSATNNNYTAGASITARFVVADQAALIKVTRPSGGAGTTLSLYTSTTGNALTEKMRIRENGIIDANGQFNAASFATGDVALKWKKFTGNANGSGVVTFAHGCGTNVRSISVSCRNNSNNWTAAPNIIWEDSGNCYADFGAQQFSNHAYQAIVWYE